MLGRARFRIRSQWALEGATTATILAAAVALVAVFGMRTEMLTASQGIGVLIAGGVVIVLGALIKATRRLDDELVARRIDRASNLADRISTAIAFDRVLASGAPADETHEMMIAAIKDGVRAAPRANVKKATPFVAPRDLRAAFAFLAVSALAAGLAIPLPDRTPTFKAVLPNHGKPGDEVRIMGTYLLTGVASPVATRDHHVGATLGAPGVEPKPAEATAVPPPADLGFVPANAQVLLGPVEYAVPMDVVDWTAESIRVRIPKNVPFGDTEIRIAMPDGSKLGPLEFTIDNPKDIGTWNKDAVVFEPEERAMIMDVINQLHMMAKKEKIEELEEFAKKLEQMMKDAEEGKITKEQLLEAVNKAIELLNANTEPNPEDIKKQLAEIGKQLQKSEMTKELGMALEKNELDKAKQELEDLARKLEKSQMQKKLEELEKKLKEDKTLTPEQKKELEKKIEEMKKALAEQEKKEQEELKKQLENQEMTQQQKDELKKKMEELKQKLENQKDLTDKQKEELKKQLEEMKKQLENKDLTPEQRKELQKKLEDMKNEKPLTEQQKQELQKQLEQVAKKMEEQQKAQQEKQQQAEQKMQEEIRRLQKQKDEAKDEKEKLAAERRLQQKKEELQKLQKENEQKNQSAQREAVKRLQRDMQKAAEQLQKPNKQESQDEQDERERQASQKLKDAARETGKVDQDQRKVAAQKRISSQIDELKEAMARAKQKGNKGGNDPFGKNGKNKDFGQRARGGKGNGEAWKPGQGQGQQGKDKQGGGNGGKEWGVGAGGPLEGDPTKMSGNQKDVDLEAKNAGSKGPSRRETILSAAQKGFASKAYEDVYQSYQKQIEDVMRNQKLPSSYKYYVKRYFAKIHPSGAQETLNSQPK